MWPGPVVCRFPTLPPGGVATPADAALAMRLGAEAVFVGSGIFKSQDPVQTGRAIVKATAHFEDAPELARVSRGIGEAMAGVQFSDVPAEAQLQHRGW